MCFTQKTKHNIVYIIVAFLFNYLLSYLSLLRNHALFFIIFQLVIFGVPSFIYLKNNEVEFNRVSFLKSICLFCIGIFIIISQLEIFRLLNPDYLFDKPEIGFLSLISVVLISPITEEYFFRVFVFDNLMKKKIYKSIYIVFLTSLIFAVFHINIYSIIFSLIPGLYLSYIMLKYKSIKNCILMHSGMNLVSLYLYKLF
jgi:membrane protease YdiL (CAAX protease family)